MILSTHAIVGAAVGSLLPSHPVAAFLAGFASHFVIDAIPHSDYPLRSISIKRDRSAVSVNWLLLRDLGMLAFDAAAGLTVALWLFAAPGAAVSVLFGAMGGILPDPLQFAHRLYPKEPLRSLQRFHARIHTKISLSWPWAISSQVLFAVVVVGIAKAALPNLT
ncbi:hypothetical protein ACVWZV_006209 [Bradyrhizobium sp. GM5.1]